MGKGKGDPKHFVFEVRPGRIVFELDGADDAKAGHVTVISTGSDTVLNDVAVNPIADTGFKAAGDALARIPPGSVFSFTTGAYPNQMASAIHSTAAPMHSDRVAGRPFQICSTTFCELA